MDWGSCTTNSWCCVHVNISNIEACVCLSDPSVHKDQYLICTCTHCTVIFTCIKIMINYSTIHIIRSPHWARDSIYTCTVHVHDAFFSKRIALISAPWLTKFFGLLSFRFTTDANPSLIKLYPMSFSSCSFVTKVTYSYGNIQDKTGLMHLKLY